MKANQPAPALFQQATTELRECSPDEFNAAPVGRYVRSPHVLLACFSRDFMACVHAGRLEPADFALLRDTVPAASALAARHRTLLDARRLLGFDFELFFAWLSDLRAYVKVARARLAANALLLPDRADMRALVHGVLAIAPPPWTQYVEETPRAALRRLAVEPGGAIERELRRLTRLVRTRVTQPDARGKLTARELEIAGLVANGFSDLNVAKALAIDEATVGSHLRSVYRKLGVHSRVELAHRLLPGLGASGRRA